ncbi:hypothetical protein MAPG_08604 [Magnaporthiopsis poae ATCC 64411]|uniref:Uncharacterized protein n=1 Tax=Magnaporthiopsis poae (strain ATCC 64411 / 73-15) TaxID=644358 RepID=A0A0C4E7T2_MAGP6|nr:hypothetical protein MAPG_08604 [Magnaporthiopsis poae ATCC 64411]
MGTYQDSVRVLASRISDMYGITFDHLVPADDDDPHTLCLLYELEREIPVSAGVDYVNERVLFPVNLADHAGKRVLAVPRCCQTAFGVQDNFRIDSRVDLRDGKPDISLSPSLSTFMQTHRMILTTSRMRVMGPRRNFEYLGYMLHPCREDQVRKTKQEANQPRKRQATPKHRNAKSNKKLIRTFTNHLYHLSQRTASLSNQRPRSFVDNPIPPAQERILSKRNGLDPPAPPCGFNSSFPTRSSFSHPLNSMFHKNARVERFLVAAQGPSCHSNFSSGSSRHSHVILGHSCHSNLSSGSSQHSDVLLGSSCHSKVFSVTFPRPLPMRKYRVLDVVFGSFGDSGDGGRWNRGKGKARGQGTPPRPMVGNGQLRNGSLARGMDLASNSHPQM